MDILYFTISVIVGTISMFLYYWYAILVIKLFKVNMDILVMVKPLVPVTGILISILTYQTLLKYGGTLCL
jgi:hypothetical protein